MPDQYEFDFEVDVNEKGEEIKPYLREPCEWCNRYEADFTFHKRGYEFRICNGCARDDYEDWAHSQLDR